MVVEAKDLLSRQASLFIQCRRVGIAKHFTTLSTLKYFFWERNANMKAMILAAGLGTRLRPLTAVRPKALAPVANQPVIDILITYLKSNAISEIIVNVHSHFQQIVDHLRGDRQDGLKIEVRVEDDILGTGGGIKNTADFWGSDPFVVINGDIITDIDLRQAFESHLKNKPLATLILHDQIPYNQIKIDDQNNLIDIGNQNQTGRLAFTGIHIIQPELLDHIPEVGFSSIIDCYRKLITAGKPIKSYIVCGHYWRDIGTVTSYKMANKEALRNTPFYIAPKCRIHSSVKFNDWAVVGGQATLNEGVEITRSILWEGVRVDKGVKITDSIVFSGRQVTKNLNARIF
jgi:NDP-sugar pyrophosphorylase family protein